MKYSQKGKHFHHLLLPLIILIFSIDVQCQNSEINNAKLSELIEQLDRQQHPNQFREKLDSIAKYTEIHDFILKRLSGYNRTAVHHVYYEPYLDYVCNNMDLIYKESIKTMIINNECDPLQLGRLFTCIFETQKEGCEFINSFSVTKLDTLNNAFDELYLRFIKSNRLKCLDEGQITNLDSFDLLKRKLNGYLYQKEFFELLTELEKYGDIHELVLENLTKKIYTKYHDFYSGYLHYAGRNMDSIYREGIINKYLNEKLSLGDTAVFASKIFYDSKDEACDYIYSKLNKNNLTTKNQKFINALLIEMKCNM